MAWPFLTLSRRGFRDADNWGRLLMRTPSGDWEVLSHSYELPWRKTARVARSRAKAGSSKESLNCTCAPTDQRGGVSNC